MKEANRLIGFIGAGRVGGALASSLREAGYRVVAVASRSPESAHALASRLPGCAATTPQRVADLCDVVFITTPDAAIAEVCDALAWRRGMAAVHTSGAESSAILAAAGRQGAATGSLHPLQTFADQTQARTNLPGSTFAVEAAGWLREALLEMVSDLEGTAIEMRAEDKALYHASAVLASNYAVTLMKMATDLWLRFGSDRAAATRALLPLLKGAVDNIEALGLPMGLTGPIARGDVGTVEKHLEALSEATPELLAAYAEMGRQTIPVALARGGLSESAAAELRVLFERRGQEAHQGRKPAS